MKAQNNFQIYNIIHLLAIAGMRERETPMSEHVTQCFHVSPIKVICMKHTLRSWACGFC
jgi:hypothetical protein